MLRPEELLAEVSRFPKARRGWIAFSGGLDSTVLLHVLADLRGEFTFGLRAIHFDHGLQAQSQAWVQHCRTVCAGLGIELCCRAIEARAARGESPEAAARGARYAALAELIDAEDLLLTAHHQDDQAETLLLALLRGSGVHGLAGMPRAAAFAKGYLVRPLLDVTRSELRDYAERFGLAWIEDPSNDRLDHDRNRLRHEIIPLLRQRWPAATRTIARAAGHCAEAAQIVDQAAAQHVAQLSGNGGWSVSIAGLRRLTPELRHAVLRYWLRACGLPVPSQACLSRVPAEVVDARGDAVPLVVWAGGEVRRYRGRLFALSPLPTPPDGDLRLAWTGCDLRLPPGLGQLSLERISAAGALLAEPFTVRFAVAGARLRRAPRAPHRSLKNVFQEAGIPPWLRPYVPLVFSGPELIAVAGVHNAIDAAGLRGVVTWSGHPWRKLQLFR